MTRYRLVINAATGEAETVAFTPEEEAEADASAAAAAIVPRSAIDAERERRIALPLPIELPSGQAFTINMDSLAQRNIQGVASVGMFRKSIGSTESTVFMDYDQMPRALTPDDMIVMGLLVSQRISTVYGYNFALKAMDPIPADYADDAYWGGA